MRWPAIRYWWNTTYDSKIWCKACSTTLLKQNLFLKNSTLECYFYLRTQDEPFEPVPYGQIVVVFVVVFDVVFVVVITIAFSISVIRTNINTEIIKRHIKFLKMNEMRIYFLNLYLKNIKWNKFNPNIHCLYISSILSLSLWKILWLTSHHDIHVKFWNEFIMLSLCNHEEILKNIKFLDFLILRNLEFKIKYIQYFLNYLIFLSELTGIIWQYPVVHSRTNTCLYSLIEHE